MKQIVLLIYFFLLISFLFNQNKLKFSADSAESSKENNITSKIFKDNVKIIDNNRVLYADKAIQYQDLNKVTLIGNVRMYENNDSLLCDELSIFKDDIEKYEARGNVEFYIEKKEIKSQNLIYITSNKNISANTNIIIKDSLRTIYGDSLEIIYNRDVIDFITIKSNAKLFNNRYIKYSNTNEQKKIQDKMETNNIKISFKSDETIKNILLKGMAIANFSMIKDSLLKGLNNISGDTIKIKFSNNLIQRMDIIGGVKGKFIPDKKNQEISSEIFYEANTINYEIENEKMLLNDNAKIIYATTILEGGEINADWNTNIVESKIKNSVMPSVSTNDSNPTYGEYMIFDLKTEHGNIINGYNQIDIGIFKGDKFITDSNEDVYIENGIFTSCNNPIPHYYFGSKKMKVMKDNAQIIAKPMILYIQDFPSFTLPFAILPNSNNKRKSGFIMPSFGHSSVTGTWIKELGYYFAPNDYYDITTYLDFYDKKKVIINSNLRYNKRYGENWYDYRFSGNLEVKSFIKELVESNDFTDIDNDLFTNESKKIKFNHTQDFDETQFLRIEYEYQSDRLLDIIENDLEQRLDQTQHSKFFYSKNWYSGTFTIGASDFKELTLPAPDSLNQIYDYQWTEYPSIYYKYYNPSVLGDGDKWYHKIKLDYNTQIFNKYITYAKVSELNDAQELVWSENSIISSLMLPGVIHNMKFNFPLKILSFNIKPNLAISEQWAISEDFSTINARKIHGSIGLNIQTKLYGLFPLNKGNISAIRHVMTSNMNFNYISKSEILSGSYDDFEQTHYSVKGASDLSSATTSFSIYNLFQAKILNSENQMIKRNLLDYKIITSYNWKTKLFSSLISSIGLKLKNGNEYLRINFNHSLYKEGTTDLIDITNGEMPRLTSLTTTLSRTFRYNIFGKTLNSHTTETDTSEDISKNKEESTSDKLWDAAFGFSLTGKYNLEDKWTLDFSTLSINSKVNLSKEWSMNNLIYVDLVNMEVQTYKVEFTRSLHCWDFGFSMTPFGYNKGFRLQINISEPSMQSIRITQSTSNSRGL